MFLFVLYEAEHVKRQVAPTRVLPGLARYALANGFDHREVDHGFGPRGEGLVVFGEAAVARDIMTARYDSSCGFIPSPGTAARVS